MICFYHSADLDGHCSGAIVKWKFTDAKMIGIDYGQDIDWEKVKGQDIIMVDFCLQPFSEKMLRLLNVCNTLLWIDHHQTEIDEFKQWMSNTGGVPEAKFMAVHPADGEKKAACELAWEFFYPLGKPAVRSAREDGKGAHIHGNDTLPLGVWLLGRYDIWDLNVDDRVLPFQWGMRVEENTLPENKKVWEDVLWGNSWTIKPIVERGELILKFRDSQNAKIMNATAFETEFEGMKFIASNNPMSNSQTFDSKYDESKHDGMISFYWKPSANAFTVSLYTTKDIDMSLIAKKYGGGGHKQACGFQCRELPFGLKK